MDEAIARIELRADDGRVLDAFTFPEPLPVGKEYADSIWLANPADSSGPGFSYAIGTHGAEIADERFAIGPGETLHYIVFRVTRGT